MGADVPIDLFVGPHAAHLARVFRGNVGFFQIWNDPALALGIV
jgi:hypothetical protein